MIGEIQKNAPLVSLITPGWNGKHFVHRLLDSILVQTYKNIEYIYIDDGSTDGSREIVLSYQEKFKERGIDFQYIWKENGGVSTAIEEGLKHVKGEFLCWPEYDDYLTPNSIEVKVNYLLSHPDCACVTSDAWLVSEEEPTKPYGVLSNYNVNRFDRNHFVQALLSNSVFTAACQMCRMDVFDETHPNRHIYHSPIGPNWQILLPLYYKHNRGFLSTPLCYYMQRIDSISNGNYQTYEKRYYAINEFIKAIKYTLKTIDMPKEDFELYNDLLDEKYAIDKLQLGYESMNKNIFNEGLAYFKNTQKTIPQRFQRKEKIINSPFLFIVTNKLRLLKRFILKRKG